ncbi:MAG TPA: SigB/SigF/SigG family RNA polymerase sigma factor [Solirubrobacterales bacterium]
MRHVHSPHDAGAPAGPTAPDPELFARAQAGDLSARDQLVRFFMPMAKRIARASQTRMVESEDLEQVANLALVLAIDRFDATRGLAFSTFAVPTITGEIKRHLRDRAWSVRVPRRLQENGLRVHKAASGFFSAEGRAPTTGKLAELTGLPVEDVLEAIEAGEALAARSLDSSGSDTGEDPMPLLERIGEEDPAFARADEVASLAPSLKRLPPRDRLILFLRFAEDMTQSEIAARIGVSQMQVSRLLRSAITRLRELNGAEAGEEPVAA